MEKKKKTKNKKRFTWVNLAQLLTVAALLLWMQWAVDSGRVLTIFVASPTSIVEVQNHENSIHCKIFVGLISVAHQARSHG